MKLAEVKAQNRLKYTISTFWHTCLTKIILLLFLLIHKNWVVWPVSGLRTWYSWAATLLAGELGLGSSRRDWMEVRIAETS